MNEGNIDLDDNQKTLRLLKMLCSHGGESEWIEFKQNNSDPKQIGEYISALANSASLLKKEFAYIVWGVEDSSLRLVGTHFDPSKLKVGNEELENWLHRLLSPRTDFQIRHCVEGEAKFVIIEVQPANSQPISFEGVEYIRVGSYSKKLRDFPEKQRKIWLELSNSDFEMGYAVTDVVTSDVLELLDYPRAFELLQISLPDNRQGIVQRLCQERLISQSGIGSYNITNLGAVLFAKDMDSFTRLSRKSLRIIQYSGKDRTKTLRERQGVKGYAAGFNGAVSFITGLLPENEEIEKAFRKSQPVYPEIAIRELVANAVIHQDFSITGTGPVVEIFADRIEITNPGTPLIEPLRFIDEPPRSRNEKLAKTMRRMNLCEERGSGVDKVIAAVEIFQLPPPEFIVTNNHTRVTLLAPKALNSMNQEERIRACYQHACLRIVSNEVMTNSTFRERLGIKEQNYPIASKVIREAIKAGLVKQVDPNAGKRNMRYAPFWA